MKKFNACVKVFFMKNGVKEHKFKEVGTGFLNDNGQINLLLDKTFNPAGAEGDSCKIYFLEPKDKHNNFPSHDVPSHDVPF